MASKLWPNTIYDEGPDHMTVGEVLFVAPFVIMQLWGIYSYGSQFVHWVASII